MRISVNWGATCSPGRAAATAAIRPPGRPHSSSLPARRAASGSACATSGPESADRYEDSMSTEVAERCGEGAITAQASGAGAGSKSAYASRSGRSVDTVASVPDSSFFAGDLATSDAARAALNAHPGSDWFARLGALALVCAAHAALLAWLVFAPGTRPVRLSPPAMIGELVTVAPVPMPTRPLAPPATHPEPQPKPPSRPAVRPAPHPEPRHEPRLESRPEQSARPAPTPPLSAPEAAPSDRAPSVPAQAPAASLSEAPQRPAAAASPA